MKYTQKLIKWFVACSVAVAMVASLQAETSQVIAKIVRIKGSARYTTGGSVWQTLKVGAQLRQGAIIQTAADSMVDIVLTEGNIPTKVSAGGGYSSTTGSEYTPTSQRDIIRIYADTVLAIDRLIVTKTGADKVTDSELDLRAGRLIGDVRKVSSASIFEIKIPNGVAGIRGTKFGADAQGIIGCKTGAVGVAFKSEQGPKSETCQAGFEYDIRTEQFSPLAKNWDIDFDNLPHAYIPEFWEHNIVPPNVNNCYFTPGVGLGGKND